MDARIVEAETAPGDVGKVRRPLDQLLVAEGAVRRHAPVEREQVVGGKADPELPAGPPDQGSIGQEEALRRHQVRSRAEEPGAFAE